jgi:hypothetical protein
VTSCRRKRLGDRYRKDEGIRKYFAAIPQFPKMPEPSPNPGRLVAWRDGACTPSLASDCAATERRRWCDAKRIPAPLTKIVDCSLFSLARNAEPEQKRSSY